MESGAVTVKIDAMMLLNQTAVHPLSNNTVCINVFREFRRFVVDESDGRVTCIGFSPSPPLPIRLNLFSYELSFNTLFPLLDSHFHDPLLSLHITERIASQAILNFGFRHAYLMSVNVVLTQNVFFTIPGSPRQETETQRVEEEEEAEEECAICLEALRSDDDNGNDEAIKLSQCSHQFHIDCISEWLTRRNSCPLCREIVLEESFETDF